MKYNAAICPLVWLQEDEGDGGSKRGAEASAAATKKQKQSSAAAAAAAAKEEEVAKLPHDELADQLCPPEGDEHGEVADENGEVAAVIWAERSVDACKWVDEIDPKDWPDENCR
jgi:hypothetical protein